MSDRGCVDEVWGRSRCPGGNREVDNSCYFHYLAGTQGRQWNIVHSHMPLRYLSLYSGSLNAIWKYIQFKHPVPYSFLMKQLLQLTKALPAFICKAVVNHFRANYEESLADLGNLNLKSR